MIEHEIRSVGDWKPIAKAFGTLHDTVIRDVRYTYALWNDAGLERKPIATFELDALDLDMQRWDARLVFHGVDGFHHTESPRHGPQGVVFGVSIAWFDQLFFAFEDGCETATDFEDAFAWVVADHAVFHATR